MEPIILKTYFIYISASNNIIQIKETTIPTNEQHIIPKMHLIQKIQSMKKDELGTYNIKNLAYHHVVLNDDNIRDYMSNKIPHNKFFKEISYFSDIIVQPTHEIFNPLSALYVIFQEKPPTTKGQTKKITFNTKKTSKRKSLKQKY